LRDCLPPALHFILQLIVRSGSIRSVHLLRSPTLKQIALRGEPSVYGIAHVRVNGNLVAVFAMTWNVWADIVPHCCLAHSDKLPLSLFRVVQSIWQ
jgi:hypothetical protein